VTLSARLYGHVYLPACTSFRGLLVPFSGKTLARTEAAFQALNQALKERAEAR